MCSSSRYDSIYRNITIPISPIALVSPDQTSSRLYDIHYPWEENQPVFQEEAVTQLPDKRTGENIQYTLRGAALSAGSYFKTQNIKGGCHGKSISKESGDKITLFLPLLGDMDESPCIRILKVKALPDVIQIKP
jgi:hypothetical protein